MLCMLDMEYDPPVEWDYGIKVFLNDKDLFIAEDTGMYLVSSKPLLDIYERLAAINNTPPMEQTLVYILSSMRFTLDENRDTFIYDPESCQIVTNVDVTPLGEEVIKNIGGHVGLHQNEISLILVAFNSSYAAFTILPPDIC